SLHGAYSRRASAQSSRHRVHNHGSARLRCGLVVALDHSGFSSGCHSGTAQAGTLIPFDCGDV
ncbi:hypothetical protein, partial [Pantoea allii]|uniref:hypothetical protein n=1 Tax=Pantoea allii TaxID=574096 RepID=UPI003D3123ED